MTSEVPTRLPRGRHGLAREEVAKVQRERMLRALAEQMTVKGYVATTVADVLRGAGVSRETFYEQFASKQDCFMAAYDTAIALILARVAFEHGADVPRGPLERFGAGLATYLDALAGEPAFARLFLVEVYAAGPAAIARRAEAQERFADLIAATFGAEGPEERFACDALVAAIGAMVTARLAVQDTAGLRALHGPLVTLAARILAGSAG